jgi:hypothetical protein
MEAGFIEAGMKWRQALSLCRYPRSEGLIGHDRIQMKEKNRRILADIEDTLICQCYAG